MSVRQKSETNSQHMETILEELNSSTVTEVEIPKKSIHPSRRFNSTSTMHVGDTLSQPNNDLTILSVSEKLFSYITDLKQEVASKPLSSSESSSENQPPKNSNPLLPTVPNISQYLRQIFKTAQCSVDCTIVCLIYIERLLQTSGLKLTTKNWRSLIAIGMLLASKVHDDLSMVNADFAVFLPFKVEQINAWERQFLAGLKYDVRVSASQYTKYYFDLREKAIREYPQEARNLVTLDVEQAQRLELLSEKVQRRMDEMKTPLKTTTKLVKRAVSDQYCASNLGGNGDGLPEPPHHHHTNYVIE